MFLSGYIIGNISYNTNNTERICILKTTQMTRCLKGFYLVYERLTF